MLDSLNRKKYKFIRPVNIYLFGMMIAIGVSVFLYLFLKEVKKRGYDEQLVLDGVLIAFIGGVIGTRV